MKYSLPTHLQPRFKFQRGVDSIYWPAAYWPSWSLSIRDVLRYYPWRVPRIALQSHPPASRTLLAPGLPPHVPVLPPVTTASPGPEIAIGDNVLVLTACVAASLLMLSYAYFWAKRTQPAALVHTIVVPAPPTPTPAVDPGIATAAPLRQSGQCSGHASEQPLIPSIGCISTTINLFEHPLRPAQEQSSTAWSIQVCAPTSTSAVAAGLPIFPIQPSRQASRQSLLAGLCTHLSLPDQPPPLIQQGRQQPDKLSLLERLHALPLGLDHADFDYADLAWRSVVGAGGFGAVYKARVRRTGQEVAVKCVRHTTEHVYERILDEVALARTLGRTPWYPEFYGAFCTWDRVFLAMEFHSGGSLHDYIESQGGHLHPRTARFYAAELLCALSHAHALGIMHRDIKPENILLDKTGHIVIIDLGLAARFSTGNVGWMHGVCGTPGFMAPEVALGQHYDTRADCFAWGVTLYYMLTGMFPALFPCDGAGQRIEAGGACYYDICNDTHVGYWERDVLAWALAHEIRDRPTLREVKRHPYWIGLDWANIEQRLVSPPVARKLGYPWLKHRLRSRRQTVASC